MFSRMEKECEEKHFKKTPTGEILMSRYADAINAQIEEFETPPNCTKMTSVELVEYHDKMEYLGCKVNTYGPERCQLFRTFAECARAEIINRYQA